MAKLGTKHSAETLAKLKRGTIEGRFWSKVDKSNPDGCWLWEGALNEWGYGRFCSEGTKRPFAHRFIFEYHNGPIPKGHIVMHSCDVPACVRPDHIRLGTLKENTQDCMRKGRFRPRGVLMKRETGRQHENKNSYEESMNCTTHHDACHCVEAARNEHIAGLHFESTRLRLALAAIESATTLEGAKYIANLALESDRDEETKSATDNAASNPEEHSRICEYDGKRWHCSLYCPVRKSDGVHENE